MGGGESDQSDAGDDPFAALRAAGMPIREASAEERAKATARRTRQINLQRRLDQEAEHHERLAKSSRQRIKKVRRTGKFRAALAPAAVLALVAALYVISTHQSDSNVAEVAAASRPPGYPPVDDTVSDAPLGTPPPAPSPAGPYEFMATQDSSPDPVAWDPCRPVRYVVNATGAPAGSESLVSEAIARVAAATGLVFVDEGATDEPWAKQREPYQPDSYGEKWAPALIVWSNEREVAGLAGYIAGLGGPIGRAYADGRLAYVSGQVALDAEDLGQMLAESGGQQLARAVIQHELGHMAGLDHVADPTQLMYSEGSEAQAGDWGTGDLAGLHELGSGDCLPEL